MFEFMRLVCAAYAAMPPKSGPSSSVPSSEDEANAARLD